MSLLSLSCPLCGTAAEALEPWLEIPVDVKTGRKITSGSLVWCRACDLGLMRRAMTPEEVRDSYDMPSYYTHGQTHFPDVRPGLVDRILVKLAYLTDKGRMMDAGRLTALQPGMQAVLDIGCGGGAFVAGLSAPGRALYGVEPDPRAIGNALARGVTVETGTAENIPPGIATRRYDLIVMTHVLEHCTDPACALQNVRELLVPGGGFYCEVPNCAALYFKRYAEISEMLDVPRHVHFFTGTSLRNLMERAGLEIVAEVHHGYTRHFTAGWRAWENRVHDLLRRHGHANRTPRRSLARDLGLIARSAFAAPGQKHDCVGLFARAAATAPVRDGTRNPG
ncbi:MAG: class I SAM-dependent methyltransferase [Tabrizicola sp.]|nr:class I SAM-dependent methyltransferase [Tabrizicola sp.]